MQIASNARFIIRTNGQNDSASSLDVNITAQDDTNPSITQVITQSFQPSDPAIQSLLIEIDKLLSTIKSNNGVS